MFLEFLGGEYSKGSESLSTNEDDVVSSPNFEDMCRRKALPTGRSNWHGRECNLLDLEGVFLAKVRVMIFNLGEEILDDFLGHDHVNLTILSYLGDISTIMTIEKWPLIQTTMEGFFLKEFLLSYDENYVPKVDVEGMISVKEKKYHSSKKNKRRSCP
jgi:hypothetical protein